MNKPCLVLFRHHKMYSEDESILLGIYSSRGLAIASGRNECHHEEDDYTVLEFDMDRSKGGTCIWTRDCDQGKYLDLYKKHWPDEDFPT